MKTNIVQGTTYRITVLTERLIRLEYDAEGIFEDRKTQTVQDRDFEEVSFRVNESAESLEITTSYLHLIYDKKIFSRNGLSIEVNGNLSAYHSKWIYGEEIHDLLGTARTLDEADGAIPLDHGILSRDGYALLDDSKSLILTEDNWVEARRKDVKDLYFWGYGHAYQEALDDYHKLTGKTPMLPRYALGNWWSRYYAYTEESYMELMERFSQEGIPFTVAVIDMDWHLVDIDPKYGSGWTGFTWNTELFPDPKRFLAWLHERGMKVTLNLHPASGIRAHEKMYREMAEKLGIDYEHEEPIAYDVTDPAFLNTYFDLVSHPYEKEGVDFWWLDWQQESTSRIEGLDPLWMINHFYYRDNGRDGKRALTFSRYAGPGSHRYPVGFSGDSIITWESLQFQPYFTVNASNIGYGWWSNDIGGHMRGIKDEEMAGRWLQFGVFSPIMRLHSSKSIFNGKEPWRYGVEIQQMMNRFLRLRHEMMPYLYTMNYLTYQQNQSLLRPMYYEYPEEECAYSVPNEYFFGTELIAIPITTPQIPKYHKAKVKGWIPEGEYIDIFNGRRYRGDRMMTFYRSIDTFPVLAKVGSILPMTEEIMDGKVLQNPEKLVLQVFTGGDGSFTLYEDDNESMEYQRGDGVTTQMQLIWGTNPVLTIESAKGNRDLLPKERDYEIRFIGCGDGEVELMVGDMNVPVEKIFQDQKDTCIVKLSRIPIDKNVVIRWSTEIHTTENHTEAEIYQFLNRAEISFTQKERIFQLVQENLTNKSILLSKLMAEELEEDLLQILSEYICAI
ncbi:MAG: glycoside hydrolase family 31 protein [Lachnospiraceae bacterium]|nr:glycoside hydrolase family 31 protein [Lachnospiraceae bacterium]